MNVTVGFLSLILAGKRTPTLSALQKIIDPFGLSKEDRKALFLLYHLEESDLDTVRRESFDELKSMRPYRDRNPKEVTAFEYFTRWYYVAIREMVQLADFKLDNEWIQSRLKHKVALGEISQALRFLVKNKFITQDRAGSWNQVKHDLTCFDGIYRFSLASFYKQIMPLATEAIEHTPRSQRHLASHTFSLNRSDFEKVRQILEQALDQIQKIKTQPKQNNTEIFHVSMTAFAMSEANSESTSKSKLEEKN